jgi:hypothetical protein
VAVGQVKLLNEELAGEREGAAHLTNKVAALEALLKEAGDA